MKKLLLIILLIFVFSYWSEVSNFVSGNFNNISQHSAQWLVDHTPKK